MTGSVLAVTINAQAGSYLSWAFPLGLFCVIAGVLYLVLFYLPRPRVPARRLAAAQAVAPDDAGTAHAAAVATGMPTAAGGGSTEGGLERPEAHGTPGAGATAAEPAADASPTAAGPGGSAAAAGPSNVSGQEGAPAKAEEPGTTDGTEASE